MQIGSKSDLYFGQNFVSQYEKFIPDKHLVVIQYHLLVGR